jgi:hypothetical protein
MQELDMTATNGAQGYNLFYSGSTCRRIYCILEHNGCFLKQTVHVKKAQDPVITKIEITNNTATVIVSGGVAPYKYSVDGTTNGKIRMYLPIYQEDSILSM